jgi:hypothetical protein
MFWSAVGSVLDNLDGRVLFVRLWHCEASNGVAASQIVILDGDRSAFAGSLWRIALYTHVCIVPDRSRGDGECIDASD